MPDSKSVVIRYAPLPIIAVEAGVGWLCLLSFTMSGERATHTRIFFEELNFVRILALVVLVFIFIASLPIVLRAILNHPAIVVTSDRITLRALRRRSYSLDAIELEVGRANGGSISIRQSGSKHARTFPLWMLRNGKQAAKDIAVRNELRAHAPAGALENTTSSTSVRRPGGRPLR